LIFIHIIENMNKINVGAKQNLEKTLAAENILSKNINYALHAGLQSVRWYLSSEDLIYLNRRGYKYEPILDPIYEGVYIVKFV